MMDLQTQQNIDSWLNSAIDDQSRGEILRLQKEDPKSLADAFFKNLEFGTGGLRGIMGTGSNRFNIYTVGAATQGLANYLNKLPKQHSQLSVIIGYDCRNHSKEFAEEAAKIFAANGIKAFLFSELRPVPLVSFGCRYLNCSAGIMITASHNPPEYNGYKVYWSDGAQILPPHDKGIIDEVNKIKDLSQIKKVSLPHALIEVIHKEIDRAYITTIKKLCLYDQQDNSRGHELKIVYSSLHGSGITLIPEVLKSWGFSNVQLVRSQCTPDGRFPTIASPNPEEPDALKMGIDQLIDSQADILMATDPDADRLGAVVLHKDKAIILNGNEMICICLQHICEALSKKNRLPSKAAFVKTIVTTELFKAICDGYQRPCFDVLTGFKYVGEKIREWEQNPESFEFIFGGEESYGSLFGTYVRDKDAISTAALFSEAALHAKIRGMTLIDVLHNLYKQHGVYREKLVSISFVGKEGLEKMRGLLSNLRSNPPTAFAGISVKVVQDYLSSSNLNLATGQNSYLTLPRSDVLLFWLSDKSKLVVRPSGTEPKIKFYCGTTQRDFESVEKGIAECDRKADLLLSELKNYFS